MSVEEAFTKVGIALALGLLVGLQRERVRSQIAGIRTIALVSVLGALCGLLSLDVGGWIIGLGALGVVALLVIANQMKLARGRAEPGLTTEMAVLVMFANGAYTVVGHTELAIALGGTVALLLYLKRPMHRFVVRIGGDDLKAIMQFALIALVILPILPNEDMGPFLAFNPYKTWWMVVLIVGMNLAGYIAAKWFGNRTGTLLSGIFGGLISSTATTASQSRQVREASDRGLIDLAAVVILIASTISITRVLVEIAAVAPGTLPSTAPPILVLLGWLGLLSAQCYWRSKHPAAQAPRTGNPAALGAAFVFGLLYAAIRFITAAANHYFGSAGLYGVAMISGLHDMDAITLSTAQLMNSEELAPATGWRVVMVAGISNLFFKFLITAFLGGKTLAGAVGVLFGLGAIGAIALIAFWPG
jgi:uncharacterized membrane protein (DUF4010 family)